MVPGMRLFVCWLYLRHVPLVVHVWETKQPYFSNGISSVEVSNKCEVWRFNTRKKKLTIPQWYLKTSFVMCLSRTLSTFQYCIVYVIISRQRESAAPGYIVTVCLNLPFRYVFFFWGGGGVIV